MKYVRKIYYIKKPDAQYIIPYIMLAALPYTITGPAIVNILEATPVINPSLFASIEGDETELEKPVIGTKAPPPPNFAILSKIPIPVNRPAININVNEARRREVTLSIFRI